MSTPRSGTLVLVVTRSSPPKTDTMSDATNQHPSTNGVTNGISKKPLFEIQGKDPVHYGVLLFPGFQALDVFGPLDVFNSLSMLYHFPIKMTMLAKTPEAVETSHQRAGNQMFSHPETDCSQSMQIDRTFEEQLKIQETGTHGDNGKGAIDVLIVPGGIGTRNDMAAEIVSQPQSCVIRLHRRYSLSTCRCVGWASRNHQQACMGMGDEQWPKSQLDRRSAVGG
jgi:hypothetical protein